MRYTIYRNNYKSCHRKHVLDKVVPQESFHSHFSQLGHNGMADWQFMLIDSASDTNTIRRKESFWQFKLNTFWPDGLNEKEVDYY